MNPVPARAGERPDGSLAGLTWAHFVNDGAANFLPGVLPLVLVSMGVPVALAGALMAALLAGQALQPVTGWLADRLGGRVLITFGVAGSSLGGVLVALAPSLWMLVPSLVLIGVANSSFHPPAMASARLLGGSRQGRAMSIMLVGGEIGRGLWPLLASAVASGLGMRWVAVLCLPGLLTAIPLYRWTPVLPRRHAGSASVKWRKHAGPVSILVGASTLRSLMIIASSTYLPILRHQEGHSLVAGASVITVILLVGIVGNLAGGHVSDRYGSKVVVVSMLAVAALMLGGILLLDGTLLWLALGLFGIAVFATLPVTVLIGQDILQENRAMGSGLAMGFSNALAALGVALLGPLVAAHGVRPALALVAAGGVLAVLLALRLPQHAKPSTTAPNL